MEEEIKEKEEKIDIEESKKRSNIFINIIIVIAILFVSILMYAKYIGTSGISVKEYRLADALIPESFVGTKIIYISDLLLGSMISLEDTEELVDEVNLRHPDVVLFGGGLVVDGYKLSKKEKEKLISLFSNIDVTLGKYAVKGSEDTEVFDEIMASSGFSILNNSYDLIYNKDNTPICLSGIGSYNLGSYDLVAGLAYFEGLPNCYSISFTHEPDLINKILGVEHKPNVILAGNSLGGEVNIPFYGPLAKFPGSEEYYLDFYEKDNVKIYISSGIGTKKYDMRLFNRPSFNFYRLGSI